MTAFSVDKNGNASGGLEQWATSAGKAVGQFKKLVNTVSTGYDSFKKMDESVRGSGTSFSDYIRYTSESEDATEAFGLATLYTKARVIALNMALSAGIGLVVSYFSKKIIEAAQRVDKLAESSKEAADAATSTTSSLSELVDEYEKLGKKSDWDTDDMEQAQKIQDEILQLAKEQGTLDEDHTKKIDLQNGKYEEQLGLLRDITKEQLKAAHTDLVQSRDAQGTKLVQTAKKNNRSHMFGTIWSKAEMRMGDQIKDAGIDIFNWAGGYGADNINDADSIVEYYNSLGKAIEYIINNTTDEERAVNGKYHALYQFLMDERDALKTDVDSYNESVASLKQNEMSSDFATWSSTGADIGDSAAVRYVDHIQKAFDILADSLGKDTKDMTISDVMGLTQNGVELTNEQASALDTLTTAANKYGTTIQGVAQAGEENGMFGNVENAVNGVAKAVQQMETISQNIDNIQSAYKACTTAMEEYNKYGYMSTDALQGLLSMNDEYLSCLDVVDGKLKINNERYADLIVAQYTEAEATAIEQAMHELEALQADDTKEKTEDLTTATEDQQTALENAVPAIQDATTATGRLAIALATANGEANGDADMEAKIKTITDALNTRLTAIHTNMQAAIKGGKALKNQLNGFDKSSNSSSKSATDVASAFDTLTKAMKEYNQYGYISADTMKSMMKLEDKFTSCLVKNGDKLEINANEFRKLVETQLKEEEASGKASKSADELKRILGYLDENVKSETISFEQLTDVIKGYGTAMADAKEKTDAIKSAFSSLSDIGKNKIENPFDALDVDGVDKQYQAIRDLYDNTDLFTDERFAGALNPETGLVDYNSDAFKQMFLEKLDGMATACE